MYFGDIGEQSRTLLTYFESNGARHCDHKENPAEYMLEIIGAGSTGKATKDWAEVWNKSEEIKGIQTELDRIHKEKADEVVEGSDTKEGHSEFAMPFSTQLFHVTKRVFQQYWRTPSYIWGKFILGIASALFIGFSFWRPDNSQQGTQDVIFSVFMITTIFTTLVQQIMPKFVTQRSLYEVRERPSKAYSWAAFLIANIIVEVPYQTLLGVVVWASFYYPVFGASQASERQGLILLFIVQFFLFASTFAHFLIAALPDAQTAGAIGTLMFSLTLTFNGVFQSPQALPGFWIFMYRVSPLTYLVSGAVSTGLGGRQIQCSNTELNIFQPPPGETCGQYLAPYLTQAPGYLSNPGATADCSYCPLSTADQFLAGVEIFYSQRWRNFGIVWTYIIFNIFAATVLYYVFRVRHWSPGSLFSGIGASVGHVFGKRGGKIPDKVPQEKKAENNHVL